MSITSPAFDAMNNSRLRSIVWPREHGAWGILLIPLVTGAWVGRPSGERIVPLVLFALAALGLFCLRTPVEIWLGVSPLRVETAAERKAVHSSIYFYASLSVAGLVILFWRVHAYGLLLLGAAAAAAFTVQAVWKNLGRQTRLNAQLTGSLALTCTAAGACYLASGRLDETALAVWAANWLFAVNQIHYVQVRIRSARAATFSERLDRGRAFLLGEALTIFLLSLAWRGAWLPGPACVAFGPVLFRGVIWFFERPRPLEIHRLGVRELIHALIFGGLFILGFQIQG